MESDSAFYSVYGTGDQAGENLTIVYLVNRNHYGVPEYCRVRIRGKPMLVWVGGYDMRILWNKAELVVSPFDRFVKVEGVQTSRNGYVVTLVAEKGRHRIQLGCLAGEIDRVLLEGRSQVLVREAEHNATFESWMKGKQRLTVHVRQVV